MTDFNLLLFSFPAVGRKAVTAAFDGGSHLGWRRDAVAMAERRLGIAEDGALLSHRRDRCASLADMVRACILAIACGYEDATISTLCAFSNRDSVGCETRFAPVSGSCPASEA